jgi:hypothetical protein
MMLPMEKAQPGMELTRDVINLNQSVLLTAGTCLTTQHLRTLKMWGVETIYVLCQATELPQAEEAIKIPPEILGAANARLNLRLKFVDNNTPGIGPLRLLATQRGVSQLKPSFILNHPLE